MDFLIYDGKVAVALLVFYLFYRFLLKKETFHRFNRVVLVGTAVLSFLLPLCVITIHKPMEVASVVPEPVASAAEWPVREPLHADASSIPWWPTVLVILFWTGVAFVLARMIVSTLSIVRIIRQGQEVREENGCKIVVTDRDIDPLSWMHCIVLSRKDWAGPHDPILTHEKAHIARHHSLEVLLVDVLSALQWFNPAVWMLRSDLKEIHEYEADDAVLRSGADIREYQYLLIRKAVSKSGYSVANSFNHSILKNRITMMSKTKSPLSRGWRVLWMLPLVCLGLGLQARTVYVPGDKDNEKDGLVVVATQQNGRPLYILRQVWGDEKEITKEEFDRLDQSRFRSIEVLKDASAKEKYGDRGAQGVIVATLKLPQELEEVVVVSYRKDPDEAVPFYLLEPETMPTFQGEDMSGFSRWLARNIQVPKDCHHAGTMKVGFVVNANGEVENVKIQQCVCEELDAQVKALVQQSPKWTPATSNGHAVDQYLTIPITFQVR